MTSAWPLYRILSPMYRLNIYGYLTAKMYVYKWISLKTKYNSKPPQDSNTKQTIVYTVIIG